MHFSEGRELQLRPVQGRRLQSTKRRHRPLARVLSAWVPRGCCSVLLGVSRGNRCLRRIALGPLPWGALALGVSRLGRWLLGPVLWTAVGRRALMAVRGRALMAVRARGWAVVPVPQVVKKCKKRQKRKKM